MKKFRQEIALILAIAFGFPMIGVIVSAPLWWHIDSRIVLWGYLTAVLVLFALCMAVSLRDEMGKDGGDG